MKGLKKIPVILDNKNIRKNNKYIEKYFQQTNQDLYKKTEKIFSSKKKITDNISCPACESKSKEQVYKISKFYYENCSYCQTVYVSNPLKKNLLIKKYKQSLGDKYYIKMMQNGYMKKYNQLLFKKYMKIIRNNFKLKSGNLIDIGCGPGVFLDYIKGEYPEYNLFASEYISDAYSRIIKIISKNNFFFQKNIETFPKNKFDIIFLWGVLEHVRNPRKFLKNCFKILKKKGVIVILIPNFNSAARDILGVNTPTLNPIVHLNFFSMMGMKILSNHLKCKLYGPYLELPIIDLMYPYIKSVSSMRKKIIKENKSYYHVYIYEKNI